MPQIFVGDNGENSDVAEGVFSDEEEEAEEEEVEDEVMEDASVIEGGVEEESAKKLQFSKVDCYTSQAWQLKEV